MTIYPTIVEVESALLAHLGADRVLADWGVEPRAIPGFEAKDFGRLFARYPAVGSYINGGKYEPDQLTVLETAPLYLICAGENLRGPAAARRGDERNPGAAHLVERCRALATAWRPGGNAAPLTATGWRQVWANNQISVCALELAVCLTRPRARDKEALEHHGSIY